MNFIQDLIRAVKEKKSVVCMGLDPRMGEEGQIPEYLKEELSDPNEIILEFNKALIDNTFDLVPIIKPNIAFYERYDALDALKETINYAHKKDLLVLLDSKRNDIGSTSEAYAYASFKVYNADAVTVNAYFGSDGVQPFLKYNDRGTFILVKTSNLSSKEFQDLFSVKMSEISDSKSKLNLNSITLERNYIQMAKLVQDWSDDLEEFQGYHNLGIVVGATYPEQLKTIRNIANKSYFLLPGYGAQGATAEDIKYGFNSHGLGAIVNSSRGIIFAYHKNKKYSASEFPKASREEIQNMNAQINPLISL